MTISLQKTTHSAHLKLTTTLIMNDTLPTLPDWIDDMLEDDSIDYDDNINESLEESYQGDFQ